MATTRKRRGAPADQSSRNAAETPTIDDGSLRALLDQLGGEIAYVRLYRMQGGRTVFISRVGTAIEQEEVQRDFGGGEYVLQLCENGGAIRGTRRWIIDGPPRDLSQPIRVETQRTGPLEPAPTSIADAILQGMRLHRELQNPPAVAQQGNPMMMAGQILEQIGNTITPFIEMLRDREPRSSVDPVAYIEQFQAGLRMGISLGKRGREPNALDRVTDALTPLLERATGTDVGAPPRQELHGPGADRAASVSANAAPSSEAGSWLAAMNSYFPRLNALAAADRDPELYADLAFDQLPPHVLEEIVRDMARGEEFKREFYARFPAAQQHDAWWSVFMMRIHTDHEAMKAQQSEGAPAE